MTRQLRYSRQSKHRLIKPYERRSSKIKNQSIFTKVKQVINSIVPWDWLMPSDNLVAAAEAEQDVFEPQSKLEFSKPVNNSDFNREPEEQCIQEQDSDIGVEDAPGIQSSPTSEVKRKMKVIEINNSGEKDSYETTYKELANFFREKRDRKLTEKEYSRISKLIKLSSVKQYSIEEFGNDSVTLESDSKAMSAEESGELPPKADFLDDEKSPAKNDLGESVEAAVHEQTQKGNTDIELKKVSKSTFSARFIESDEDMDDNAINWDIEDYTKPFNPLELEEMKPTPLKPATVAVETPPIFKLNKAEEKIDVLEPKKLEFSGITDSEKAGFQFGSFGKEPEEDMSDKKQEGTSFTFSKQDEPSLKSDASEKVVSHPQSGFSFSTSEKSAATKESNNFTLGSTKPASFSFAKPPASEASTFNFNPKSSNSNSLDENTEVSSKKVALVESKPLESNEKRFEPLEANSIVSKPFEFKTKDVESKPFEFKSNDVEGKPFEFKTNAFETKPFEFKSKETDNNQFGFKSTAVGESALEKTDTSAEKAKDSSEPVFKSKFAFGSDSKASTLNQFTFSSGATPSTQGQMTFGSMSKPEEETPKASKINQSFQFGNSQAQSSFQFGSTLESKKEEPIAKPTFTFGSTPSAKPETGSSTSNSFSFGSSNDSTKKPSFQFGSSSAFSFAPTQSKSVEETTQSNVFGSAANESNTQSSVFGSTVKETNTQSSLFGSTQPVFGNTQGFSFGSSSHRQEIEPNKRPPVGFGSQSATPSPFGSSTTNFGASGTQSGSSTTFGSNQNAFTGNSTGSFAFGGTGLNQSQPSNSSFGSLPSSNQTSTPSFNFGGQGQQSGFQFGNNTSNAEFKFSSGTNATPNTRTISRPRRRR